ncbi:MAG: hypothetical protein ACK48E_00745 [Holosporales bacterium]
MTILLVLSTIVLTHTAMYRVGYGVGYLNGYNQGLQGEKTQPTKPAF